MHLVIDDQIRFHWLKGADSDVEGNEFVWKLLEQLLGKMEARGRRGHCSSSRSKNSLVSLGIGRIGFAFDVRRQRHFAALFQIQGFGKSNLAVAIFKNSGNLAAELRFNKPAAYRKPGSWPDQATPSAIIDLPKEKDFRIPILELDPSWNHSGIIQDQQFLRRNEID